MEILLCITNPQVKDKEKQMNKLPKELLDTQVFHVRFKPFVLGMSPKSKYKDDFYVQPTGWVRVPFFVWNILYKIMDIQDNRDRKRNK